jgi:hypothetical protein
MKSLVAKTPRVHEEKGRKGGTEAIPVLGAPGEKL